MSCVVSKSFILLTDAKDRRFSCNCLAYCCQKSTKKHRIDTFFELKWFSPLSLSVLCASDNLNYILLQLGTYVLCTLHINHKNYLRRPFIDPHITAGHCETSYGPLKD